MVPVEVVVMARAQYKKTFQNLNSVQFDDMFDWCCKNISEPPRGTPVWFHEYDNHGCDTFYFADSEPFTLFLLRWS